MTSQWSSEGESKEEILVGYVSGVGGGRGVAYCEGEEVSFPSDQFQALSGYRPHVNDWVKVRVGYQHCQVTPFHIAGDLGLHGKGVG